MKHLLKQLYARLAVWHPPPPDPPPPSRAREPKPHRPGGGRDAIAVAEPDPERSVDVRSSTDVPRGIAVE
jgi:hypothetical protein